MANSELENLEKNINRLKAQLDGIRDAWKNLPKLGKLVKRITQQVKK